MILPKEGDKFNALLAGYPEGTVGHKKIARDCPCICTDVNEWEVLSREVKKTKWCKIVVKGKKVFIENRDENLIRQFPYRSVVYGFTFEILGDVK